MDLAPRTSPDNAPVAPRRRKARFASLAIIAIVLVGGSVIVAKFLTSAVDYYCNVDEIGLRTGCETGRQLRVQGMVDKNTLASAAGATTFSMSFNNKTMRVVYSGDPGGIFQECIPVVIHGVLQPDGVFEGDDIEVKHSNEYSEKNQDRLDDAESAACSQQP